jgi:hypothetical protein
MSCLVQKQKWLERKNNHRAFVESFHLNAMVVNYHWHFVICFKDNKQVTQLIWNLVWKAIYGEYKEIYVNLVF